MPRKTKRKNKGISAQVRNVTEDVRERFEETRDRAEGYVRHHPIQSVIIAAGVGAAVAVGVTAIMMRPKEKTFFDRLFGLF